MKSQQQYQRHTGASVFSALLGIALCFAVLLSAVLQTGTDRRFYAQQQQKLGIAGALNITDEELDYITDQTVAFLQGQREDFDIRLREKSFFYEDEQVHMLDVRDLFSLGKSVSIVLFASVSAFGVLLALRFREGLWMLARGYRLGCVIFLTLLAAVAAFVIADWNAAFDLFHRLLQFDDGTWVFWPGTPLVTMLPNEFFMACGVRIAVQTAGTWLVLFIISVFVRRPSAKIEEE